MSQRLQQRLQRAARGTIILVSAVALTITAPSVAAASADKKINSRLAAKMASLSSDAKLNVSIWLNVGDPPVRRTVGGDVSVQSAEAALDSQLDSLRAWMAPKRQGVIDALRRMGVEPRAPQYSPAVFAQLTRGQIQRLARRSDVGAVYGQERYVVFADDAATTERIYNVWNAGNLGFGTSSRPVVHEPGGVADFNPFLNNANHPVIFYCASTNVLCPAGKNIASGGGHATSVAGMIVSTHPLIRGKAPNAQVLLSANTQDFADANLVEAFEWARGNGGDPTNMSWGTICGGFQTFMSRQVDWWIRNTSATFVIAAGNSHPDCMNATDNEQVSAPALAWGAIAVGAHEDDNNGFWAGDSMSAFSKWRDPDFDATIEKPEVVGVGENVRTTDHLGGDHLTPGGISGTSFSSPNVAGLVTLLLARRPGQNIWPETNKAAVMAGAFHDIELVSPGGAGDLRDGAGSVMGNVSDNIYLLNRFRNGCGAGCGPLMPADFPQTYLDAASLAVGQRVRVVTAWDSVSTGGGGTDTLGVRLNLQVRHPNNTTIVCSNTTTANNAWKVCEFTVPVTGLYDIIVSLGTAPPVGWPGTFLGTAWGIRSVPDICTTATTIPATGGTFARSTANGHTYFDSYAGWALDNSGRESVMRLVLTSTKDITVTDTNSLLDLHVIQFPSCAGNPIVPTIRANGANSASVNDAAAGTYYIVVDGRSGAVGSTTATVAVTGP
jgi:hypothetical protein